MTGQCARHIPLYSTMDGDRQRFIELYLCSSPKGCQLIAGGEAPCVKEQHPFSPEGMKGIYHYFHNKFLVIIYLKRPFPVVMFCDSSISAVPLGLCIWYFSYTGASPPPICFLPFGHTSVVYWSYLLPLFLNIL